jgi:hypothetical protein
VFWVEKFNQDLKYNVETCRRDAGLMVDAIARDTLTGSNFASIKAGMSYYRILTSTAEVINNQDKATIGSVNFLKNKVKHTVADTASAHAEIIIDDITATINGGARPSTKWKPLSNADDNDVAAASIIWENKGFIQAEVLEFLSIEYPNVMFSQDKCSRDVGMLVDALRYDLVYGGTSASEQFGLSYYLGAQLQIDTNDKTATIAAYDYIKFLASDLAVNTLGSPFALQSNITPKFRDTDIQIVGDANSAARVDALIEQIKDIIDVNIDALPTIIVNDVTSNVMTTTTAHGLNNGDEISLSGLGLLGFNNLEGNVSYYVNSVPSSTEFTVSSFFNGTTVVLTDDGAANETLVVKSNPSTSAVSSTLKQQATNISGSISAIKTSISEYIAENYPTLDYDIQKCERDVGYIAEAVIWDMMLDSNYRTLIAALSYYRGAQADLVLGEQKTATIQSYRELKNVIASYVSGTNIVNGLMITNAKKRVNALMDIVINMLDKGENESPEITGTVTYFNDIQTINGVDILIANKNFLANEATAWISSEFTNTIASITGTTITTTTPHMFGVGDPVSLAGDNTKYIIATVPNTTSFTVDKTIVNLSSNSVTYRFEPAACRRDMDRYIDAIVYDLQYPGNFKSLRAAELYLNAINGSERSDMYRVRNSTGVRNQTLNGLRGNLSEKNEYGTRRPTAGAYVALDPGFGPNDTEAWITNKSPYIQNVTTFGVGCVGNKIDGGLHSGGNRSMVSNDFTQVLSDGIGVWCSGNNSLTELVSVFAYYNYAGYIADFGARIRATNGNSSYGTYGVIAEGTDTGEVPLFCEVDNLSNDAFSTNVLSNGQEVLRLEFDNAGVGYTNAQYAISGDGFNASVVADEYRDSAIFETRLIDLDDGNGIGGADYVTAKNVAQGGDLVTGQLAATDTALANAYNGMH